VVPGLPAKGSCERIGQLTLNQDFTLKQFVLYFYHDPSPFRQGTSIGKGSNFLSLSLIIKSSGMSLEIVTWMFMMAVPGISISSGTDPSTN
jgi:hypothetical protein